MSQISPVPLPVNLQPEPRSIRRKRSLNEVPHDGPPIKKRKERGHSEVEPIKPVKNRTQHRRLELRDLECIRTLGRGSFANVLLVRAKKSDPITRSAALYAMKVITKKSINSPELTHVDLRNEMRILHMLPWNPFVAGLIGAYADARNIYLTLEFIPHGTLLRRLRDAHGCLPEPAVRFYAANLTCALEFLHTHGVVHCDLKPENILVGADGYLSLADFGMAKHERDLAPGGVGWVGYGTMRYMAPEIIDDARDDPPDMRAAAAIDWWAVGCILYELVTGSAAFKGSKYETILAKVQEGIDGLEWPDNSNISQELKDLVRLLLQSEASQRLCYQGVDEIKTHPWLSSIQWDDILDRITIAPWVADKCDFVNAPHTLPLPTKRQVPGLAIVKPPVIYKYSDDVRCL